MNGFWGICLLDALVEMVKDHPDDVGLAKEYKKQNLAPLELVCAYSLLPFIKDPQKLKAAIQAASANLDLQGVLTVFNVISAICFSYKEATKEVKYQYDVGIRSFKKDQLLSMGFLINSLIQEKDSMESVAKLADFLGRNFLAAIPDEADFWLQMDEQLRKVEGQERDKTFALAQDIISLLQPALRLAESHPLIVAAQDVIARLRGK
jgi:hypothetical protein